ncbi:MAG: hypothetical protein ABI867_21325 [Kofleriaceae bacterium]
MAVQFERIIRRVKYSMNYRGSYNTRDILGALVARWIESGEWVRLKTLPFGERRIGESVRRFILDRLSLLRVRSERTQLDEDAIVMPDDTALLETIELAELRMWLEQRVCDLVKGTCDPRIRIPLPRPDQVGAVLRRHLAGLTQRQIAAELDLSLGAVNKRILEGTNYLILLRGLDHGIGLE